MKREWLKELELTDEQIKKIMDENGKDIEAVKTKYADYDTVKEQLAAANTQIEEFKGLDIEGVKRAAEDWKVKAEKAETDAKAQIEALQFDHALEAALSGSKAKNGKAVKALLDMDGLKLNNGEIVGISEQLEKLKAENDYLFESDNPPPRLVGGTPGGDPSGPQSLKEALTQKIMKKE